MTEDELIETVADLQAMSITNRHLIALLYEEVLRGDPEADAKLRRVADQLIPFLEDTPNPRAAANMVRLTDGFLTTLRARLGL